MQTVALVASIAFTFFLHMLVVGWVARLARQRPNGYVVAVPVGVFSAMFVAVFLTEIFASGSETFLVATAWSGGTAVLIAAVRGLWRTRGQAPSDAARHHEPAAATDAGASARHRGLGRAILGATLLLLVGIVVPFGLWWWAADSTAAPWFAGALVVMLSAVFSIIFLQSAAAAESSLSERPAQRYWDLVITGSCFAVVLGLASVDGLGAFILFPPALGAGMASARIVRSGPG